MQLLADLKFYFYNDSNIFNTNAKYTCTSLKIPARFMRIYKKLKSSNFKISSWNLNKILNIAINLANGN